MLLAIDSGANQGWALFTDSKHLIACGVGQPPLDPVSKVVVEKPRSKGNTVPLHDIIVLAIRAGEIGGVLRKQHGVEPKYIEPSTWKGSLPKARSNEITWSKLTPAEKSIVATAGQKMAVSKRHNMLDAIGIGLYEVMR